MYLCHKKLYKPIKLTESIRILFHFILFFPYVTQLMWMEDDNIMQI